MFTLTGGPLHGEIVFDIPDGYQLASDAATPTTAGTRVRQARWDHTRPAVYLT